MNKMKIAAIVVGTLGVVNALVLYACVRAGAEFDKHLEYTDDNDFDTENGNWWEEYDEEE